MLSAVLLTFATLAQPVSIRLAPDQPAPIFFTDEPLVVQFESSESITTSADLLVTLPSGERASWSAQQVALLAGRPMWHDVGSFPVARGPHEFHVRGDPTQTSEFRQTLVRLDRPRPNAHGLLGVHLTNASPAIMYALRCLPVAAVRIDADTPNLAVAAREVALNTPGNLYVRTRAGDTSDRDSVTPLARELANVVDLWEIAGADDATEYAGIAGDIRRGHPAARLAARVSSGRDAVALARAQPELCPDVFVVAPDSLEAVEQAMQRAGIEGPNLLVEFNPPVDQETDMTQLVPRLLSASLMRHHEAMVPQRVFETSIGYSGSLSIFANTTRLLDGTELFTVLDGDGNNRAWLYGRLGDASPPDWLVVIAHTDPNEPQPQLPDAAAESWTLYDAHGNTRAESAAAGAPVGDLPGYGLWFVRGLGGNVLLNAHVQRLRQRAAATLPHEDALTVVAPDALTALRLLRNFSYPSPTRAQFINLVRSLPAIEEAWHRGVIEPRDAVPLSAQIAAVARELAAIKQEMDEQFLEPLERTFSNCREILDAFPAAEAGADLRRVGFLRGEVALLLDEARACEAAGRSTEAKGIAALAEWRARSLEPAATIPLIDEEESHDDVVAGDAPAQDDAVDPTERPAPEAPNEEPGP